MKEFFKKFFKIFWIIFYFYESEISSHFTLLLILWTTLMEETLTFVHNK